jgi:ribosomal subunit interface protein
MIAPSLELQSHPLFGYAARYVHWPSDRFHLLARYLLTFPLDEETHSALFGTTGVDSMKQAPSITFRDIDSSEAVESKLRKRIDRLERYSSEIISCQVVVETPHRARKKGKIYKVSIDLTVPGDEIVVNRNPEDNHSHEDVYVAIRDAFDAAERQLKEYAERRRGDVKRPNQPPPGVIDRLFPEEDYGFIDPKTGGAHVYFHRNAVVGESFDDLEEGTPVRFTEEAGDEGPQATSVHIISDASVVGGDV